MCTALEELLSEAYEKLLRRMAVSRGVVQFSLKMCQGHCVHLYLVINDQFKVFTGLNYVFNEL